MTQYSTPLRIDAFRRNGTCKACGKGVSQGEPGWILNRDLFCDGCKPEGNATQKRLEPNIPPPVPVAYRKCDLCGEQAPEHELGYFTNAKLESFRVCGFCRRVNTCAAYSKIAGLWVVTKRPEAEKP